jgi:hypothetical protein
MVVLTDRVSAGTEVSRSGGVATGSCPQESGSRVIKYMHEFMRRGVVLLCVFGIAAALAPETKAQSEVGSPVGISVQESEQIFAVMCALDAAGFNADESTLGDMPERLQLRTDLLKMQGPATKAIRDYYNGHPIADPDELLSQYVTFALVIGPPPDFSFTLNEDALPPEAVSLEDFQPLLSAFYDEAKLGPRWKKIEPEYESLAGNYRSIVRNTVVKTNAYLRDMVSVSNGRSFTVYVEPLAGTSTNFRNFGDQYAVVVGAKPSESAAEIQHAYLHFMLDPMVLKDRNNLPVKSAILNVAARAPLLPEQFKTDFVSYVDECVVKSVELRLRELPPDQQEAVLKEDDEDGFVMVRPLVAGLLKYEKDNPSMNYYLAEMIAGVDVTSELQRLQNVKFASAEPGAAPAPGKPAASAGSDEEALLAQGDREIALRDGASAAEIFQKVLDKYPNEPHALYGMAVASVMTGHAEESKTLFEKVVSQAANGNQDTDPGVLAWSHIYLGRLDDLEDDRDTAVKEYRAALAVAGAPEAAQVAAQHGVDQAYAPPARGGNSSQ